MVLGIGFWKCFAGQSSLGRGGEAREKEDRSLGTSKQARQGTQ